MQSCISAAAFDDLLRAAEHVVVGLGRLAAHLELELRRLADDVAARARVERADVQLRRRIAVAGDGVQVQNGGRRGEQCVAALLRGDARVGGAAVERHVQLGGGKTSCSVLRQNADVDESRGLSGGEDMGGKRVVRIVEMPGGDDGACAAHALFGGLEDQADGPVQLIAQFAQQHGRADADGGVAVMPAGVHDAGRDGAEALAGGKMRLIVRLQYAERVDIKSQRNGRPLAAVHGRDHAGEAAARGREKFRVRAVFLAHL